METDGGETENVKKSCKTKANNISEHPKYEQPRHCSFGGRLITLIKEHVFDKGSFISIAQIGLECQGSGASASPVLGMWAFSPC